MSFRKILVGIFMAGIICCGIGAGVTFQEYSSFKYMGEKRIGSNKIAEKTLTENLYTDKTKKLNTSFIAYNNENENIELKTSIYISSPIYSSSLYKFLSICISFTLSAS